MGLSECMKRMLLRASNKVKIHELLYRLDYRLQTPISALKSTNAALAADTWPILDSVERPAALHRRAVPASKEQSKATGIVDIV